MDKLLQNVTEKTTALKRNDLSYRVDSTIIVEGVSQGRRMTRQNEMCPTFTKVQMDAIRTAGLLDANDGFVTNQEYLIPDATDANISLIVQATSATTIGTEAKSPLFPEDIIAYDFLTDTILSRYDTIRDIMGGGSWRNNGSITIHPTCSHVEFGSGCTITLPANSSNVKVGNNSTLIAGFAINKITIGNNSSVTLTNTTAITSQNVIGDNCTITAGEGFNGNVIKNDSEITAGTGFSSNVLQSCQITAGNTCIGNILGSGTYVFGTGCNFNFSQNNCTVTLANSSTDNTFNSGCIFTSSTTAQNCIVSSLSTITLDVAASGVTFNTSNQTLDTSTYSNKSIIADNPNGTLTGGFGQFAYVWFDGAVFTTELLTV